MRARLIEELQGMAKQRLPRAIYDTIEGGGGAEAALRRSRAALEAATLTPRVLRDVSSVSTETLILGRPAHLPIIVAPTGMNGFYWPRGELAMTRAATAAGIVQAVSAFASVSLEELSAVGAGRRWFQIYPLSERRVMEDLVRRAKSAGFEALCVTVDAPAVAMRNRDVLNRVQLPPKLNARLLGSILTKPAWALPFALGYRPSFANLAALESPQSTDIRGLATPALDPAFSWADLERLARLWDGPLIVKGLMHRDDARRAHQAGAVGVVISNHGGRQFEPAPAVLDALGDIRAAGPAGLELYADGAIMSGSDVLIYLAAGANACLVGRAFLYGLAAGGERGAGLAMKILADQLRLAMMLAGRVKLPLHEPESP